MKFVWLKRLWLMGLVLACSRGAHGQDTASSPVEFNYPLALVATRSGEVFVADRNLPGIWKIKNGTRNLYFQASKKFRTPLNAVRCLAIDHQGNLLAGDSATREVYRFSPSGQPQPLTHGWIGIPMAIAVTPDGTIYTADLETHRIWKMPSEGAEMPTEFARIDSPRGITLDGEGNLWVLSTSSKEGQIQKVTPDGKKEAFIKDHPFNLPHNIVRFDNGDLFVTDSYEHAIWKITPDGIPKIVISGAPLDRPVGLCRNGNNLLIADPHIRTIFSFAPDKTFTILSSSPTSFLSQAPVANPGVKSEKEFSKRFSE